MGCPFMLCNCLGEHAESQRTIQHHPPDLFLTGHQRLVNTLPIPVARHLIHRTHMLRGGFHLIHVAVLIGPIQRSDQTPVPVHGRRFHHVGANLIRHPPPQQRFQHGAPTHRFIRCRRLRIVLVQQFHSERRHRHEVMLTMHRSRIRRRNQRHPMPPLTSFQPFQRTMLRFRNLPLFTQPHFIGVVHCSS